MTRISFLNDKFLPHTECFVHIEDRGLQFADGIYEVILFYNGKLIDGDAHIDRLFRSLKEIDLKFERNKEEIKAIILELFKKNNLENGSVYLQITRGQNPRMQAFPAHYIPTLIITASPFKPLTPEQLQTGFSAITHPDIRWGRCDIKSVGLLASSIARQKAESEGFSDAILIQDNYVTECSFSNVFIVDNSGNIITRNTDNNILAGITRNRVIALAKSNNISVYERKFVKEELLEAREVFATSTTLFVRPIVKIDNKDISLAKVGDVTKKLINLYQTFLNS